jgi:peptidoglycan/xylan/chitin deacetylase (PgdA/CDA1 family)
VIELPPLCDSPISVNCCVARERLQLVDMPKALLRNAGRRLIGPVTHFATDKSPVALTFDDGPDPEYTPQLLAILERHNVRATFFMVGQRAARHSELVRRVAEAGHAVANHSWDHPVFATISGPQRREQIRACGNALAPYGKRFFRAPFGTLNAASLWDVFFLRYEVIGWNLDVKDWTEENPRLMADLLIDRCRPGSIVLLHDAVMPNEGAKLHEDREAMFQALNLFLERKGREFQFVTIPEIFRLARPVRQG